MRDLERIIIHYSATYPGQDIGADEIRLWHRERGWRDIGYHYVVRLDGTVEEGRPVADIGAHARGHNADSVGICYIGGLHDGNPHDGHDTRTPAQRVALRNLVIDIQARYGPMDIIGHRDVGATECPGFDVGKSDLAGLRYWEATEGWPDMGEPAIIPPTFPVERLKVITPTHVEALNRVAREEGVGRDDLKRAARLFGRWLDEVLRSTPWYARAITVLRAIRDLLREIGR